MKRTLPVLVNNFVRKKNGNNEGITFNAKNRIPVNTEREYFWVFVIYIKKTAIISNIRKIVLILVLSALAFIRSIFYIIIGGLLL